MLPPPIFFNMSSIKASRNNKGHKLKLGGRAQKTIACARRRHRGSRRTEATRYPDRHNVPHQQPTAARHVPPSRSICGQLSWKARGATCCARCRGTLSMPKLVARVRLRRPTADHGTMLGQSKSSDSSKVVREPMHWSTHRGAPSHSSHRLRPTEPHRAQPLYGTAEEQSYRGKIV